MKLSPNVSRMSLRIIAELDRSGTVRRPAAPLWQNRIHNAARKAGFVVRTKTIGEEVVAHVVGWR